MLSRTPISVTGPRAETSKIDNLGGWLTTIVARVCLNMLRSRNVRQEESLEVHLPDPVISPAGELGPEGEALLADSVGLALLGRTRRHGSRRAPGLRPP